MATSLRQIPPGATIGILGSGQLGRMLAMAAAQLGYRTHVFSPDPADPAAQVAAEVTVAAYDDLEAVARFARRTDVITLEFENVPVAATTRAAEFAPVRPDGGVLHITQQRLREKTFLRDQGLPTTRFAALESPADAETAVAEVGLPAILKTAAWGYDGKGQSRVVSLTEVRSAARDAKGPLIAEAIVDFQCELSVIVARGLAGERACYGPLENEHARHILDVSLLPARVSDEVERQAREIALAVAEALELVGVLCVEMFLTGDGALLINELAPRPHNSGHLTIEACPCSQFEQQIRAVCGLPLGETRLRRPAAMANLLGELWREQTPDWSAALESPEVHLHLYGKGEPRRGRKMGHLTALAATVDAARDVVVEARRRLSRRAR